MNSPATVMFIVEQGGYPLFLDDVCKAGYEVLVVQSMRKALAMLKTATPKVILAEFNYGPRYGVQISNLEPLLATLQSRLPHSRVIVFLEPQFTAHLDQLRIKFPIADALQFPLARESLLAAISRAADAD